MSSEDSGDEGKDMFFKNGRNARLSRRSPPRASSASAEDVTAVDQPEGTAGQVASMWAAAARQMPGANDGLSTAELDNLRRQYAQMSDTRDAMLLKEIKL